MARTTVQRLQRLSSCRMRAAAVVELPVSYDKAAGGDTIRGRTIRDDTAPHTPCLYMPRRRFPVLGLPVPAARRKLLMPRACRWATSGRLNASLQERRSLDAAALPSTATGPSRGVHRGWIRHNHPRAMVLGRRGATKGRGGELELSSVCGGDVPRNAGKTYRVL